MKRHSCSSWLIPVVAAVAITGLHADDTAKKSGLEKFGDAIGSKMEKVGEKIDAAAGKAAEKMEPQKPEDAAKSMEAMLPKPSPEHERLKKLVGTWDLDISATIVPGQPAQQSKGTEVDKMLGDFWIVSDTKSDMMGMPFFGHGVYGFDPYKNRYVGIWVDSMTAEIMSMEGACDEKTQVTTWEATIHDPVTKKVIKQRVVDAWEGETVHVMKFYMPGPDGKEFEAMSIKYKKES